MDLNCEMGLNFAETENLDDSDYVNNAPGISDKLEIGPSSDDVTHFLVFDHGSSSSQSCDNHNTNKSLTTDFKLDLGPANDLVSATDFPIETSVSDISSDIVNEEHEGYSIRHAALEGVTEIQKPQQMSIGSSCVPASNTHNLISNYHTIQVIPIGNIASISTLKTSPSGSTGLSRRSGNESIAQLLAMRKKAVQNASIPKLVSIPNQYQTVCSNNPKITLHTANSGLQQFALPVSLIMGDMLLLQPVSTCTSKLQLASSSPNSEGRVIGACSRSKEPITKNAPATNNVLGSCSVPGTNTIYNDRLHLDNFLPNTSAPEGQGTAANEETTNLFSSPGTFTMAPDTNSKEEERNPTKIVIAGNRISMTFDCRSASASLEPPTKKNEKQFLQFSPKAKEPLPCTSDVKQNNIKYVSLLEKFDAKSLQHKKIIQETISNPSVDSNCQSQLTIFPKHPQKSPEVDTKETAMSSVSNGLSTSENKATDSGLSGCYDVQYKQEMHSCDLCDMVFSKIGNLKRHRKRHSIKKEGEMYPYECSVCSRRFLQRCDMKRHMLVHSKQEPHKCQICGKGYIRRSDLVVHTRFHLKDKKFTCHECNKSFYQSGDLNRHVRNVHDPNRMLTCIHCGKQFTNTSLLRHVQTHHKEMVLNSLHCKPSVNRQNNGKVHQPNRVPIQSPNQSQTQDLSNNCTEMTPSFDPTCHVTVETFNENTTGEEVRVVKIEGRPSLTDEHSDHKMTSQTEGVIKIRRSNKITNPAVNDHTYDGCVK